MITKIKYGRIKTGFSVFTGAALAAYAKSIGTALAENANFPLTQKLLKTLAAVLSTFNGALANAQSRDKVAVGIKNTTRTELEVQLLSVANSVQNEAQGNLDKLLSCGFALYKNGNTPAPPLGEIKNFNIIDGINPGQLKLQSKGATGAKSFLYKCAPEPITPSTVWINFASTKKEYTFSNLESGKRYTGQMMAIGIKDQVTISNPVSRIVQ